MVNRLRAFTRAVDFERASALSSATNLSVMRYKHSAISSIKDSFIADIKAMDAEVETSGRHPETDHETFQKLSAIFEVWDKQHILSTLKTALSAPGEHLFYRGPHLTLKGYKIPAEGIHISNTYFSSYLVAGFATETLNQKTLHRGLIQNSHSTPGKIGPEGLHIQGTGLLITLEMDSSATTAVGK
jgi:hypothetical protein